MKAVSILLLICCVAGCGEPDVPVQSTAAGKAATEKKLKEAKRQFSAFLEAATQGATLLESHPDKEAIEKQIKTLEGLLDRASGVYPSDKKMAALADEGRNMMKYFDACVGTMNVQSTRKGVPPDTAKKGIAFACDSNAGAIRELIRQTKDKLGP
jgi:hypothetical protein